MADFAPRALGLPNDLALPTDIAGWIAAGAAAGSLVFALGVAIGTITYIVIRLAFCAIRRKAGRSHELGLTTDALKGIWELIGATGNPNPRHEVLAGVTFDHGVLYSASDGIHKWLRRRWNAFSISSTSFFAIALSLAAGALFGISMRAVWVVPAACMLVVFAASSYFSWCDTMDMFAFHARNKGLKTLSKK